MSSLADYILGFCSQSPEARQYAETHLGRFVKTVELTPEGSEEDRLLEMGAYMQITPALANLGYGEVRGSYLGPPGEPHAKTVRSLLGETYTCWIDLFNAELDAFPYPDGHFAAVVCCELVEHLAEDPMHMMAEINRILRPGGALVMSTPNICSFRSVRALLSGYHPELFSKYTARHGGNTENPRHAREYAPRELALLLEAAGFGVERLETTAFGLERPPREPWLLDMLDERGFTTELRDDTLHVRGAKTGPVIERYPEWLYT